MADTSFAAARILRTVVFVAALCAPAVAQPPAKATDPKAGRTLDALKVPPGTVIVISDNPREAFQHVDAVVLSPDEYRRLVEAAEQSKRPAAPDRPEVPSVCRIGGRVESRGSHEIASLRVSYAFRTTVPRTVVQLGLQKGKPTAARLGDGKLPVLLPGKEDEGLAALIDGVGEHALTVDIEVPLTSRGSKGGERGFELGLPGAAITAIEKLELPDGAARVRVGGRTVPPRALTQANAAYVLGPVPRLDVVWDVPAASGPVELQTVVDGVADVRIDEKFATTHTRLMLKVQRGTAGEFRIQMPPNAELTADGTDADVKIERPPDPQRPVWVVRREASADELRLDAVTRTELRPGDPIRVVLPSVTGAGQQRGTIAVAGLPTLRLAIHLKPGAELARREGSDDTAFTYSRIPTGPLLEIEVTALKGEVETTIGHQLTLSEIGWRWQGRLEVRPVRAEVGHLDIELPPELQEFRAVSAELVESIRPLQNGGAGRRVVRLQLAESRRKPFAVVLEGVFPLPSGATSANLSLPRTTSTLDRGGTLAATVPAGMELRAALREWVRDRIGEWERALDAGPRGPVSAVATFDHAPARLDVSWRSPRDDVPTTASVHVFLGEHQSTVRHVWTLSGATRKFVLRGPPSLAGRLRVDKGGTATPVGPGEWSAQATAGSFAVEYSFPLATDETTPVAVPLVWPEPCPRGETEVCVWAGPTLAPPRAIGPWTELPPQPVADQLDLPALCLRGVGGQLPLSLELRAADIGSRPVVEKQWAQVVLDASGQAYRVRAWVRPARGRRLSVELPAGIDAARASVLVDGKRVTTGNAGRRRWFVPTDSDGGHDPRQVEMLYTRRPAEFGREVAIDLPEYPGVEPPPTRVQVAVPPNSVPLASGHFSFNESWNWNRVMPVLRPAQSTADIASWFSRPGQSVETDPSVADNLDNGLYAASAVGGGFRIFIVPRPILMLVMSTAALLAFAGVFVAGSGWLRAVLAMVIVVGAAAVAIAAPHAAGRLLMASLPGILAIPVIIVVRSVLLRRYRRGLLALPGFSRDVPTSRSVNGFAARREPSTVDSPERPAERSSSRQVVS